MTAAGSGARRAGLRYVRALTIASVAAASATLLLPRGNRPVVWGALMIALAAQAPLGWWLVGAVGQPRFLGIWAAGMLVRLALVGVLGMFVVPVAGWPGDRLLIPLVAFLTLFVLLEGVVLMMQHSRVEI